MHIDVVSAYTVIQTSSINLLLYRILPSTTQQEEETTHEFALRVQRMMAEALSVDATPYTSADKMEHIKRLESAAEPRRQPGMLCLDL